MEGPQHKKRLRLSPFLEDEDDELEFRLVFFSFSLPLVPVPAPSVWGAEAGRFGVVFLLAGAGVAGDGLLLLLLLDGFEGAVEEAVSNPPGSAECSGWAASQSFSSSAKLSAGMGPEGGWAAAILSPHTVEQTWDDTRSATKRLVFVRSAAVDSPPGGQSFGSDGGGQRRTQAALPAPQAPVLPEKSDSATRESGSRSFGFPAGRVHFSCFVASVCLFFWFSVLQASTHDPQNTCQPVPVSKEEPPRSEYFRLRGCWLVRSPI